MAYFAGFDVVTRDTDGYFTPLAAEDVAVKLVGGADLPESPLTSDAYGAIESQSLTVTAGAEIEFYSATKTGSFRQIAVAVQADSFSPQATLILDDAFATYADSSHADIYLRDTGETGVALTLIGVQKKGTTAKYAVESAFNKNLEIVALSRTEEFQFAEITPDAAPSDSVSQTRSVEDEITVGATDVLSGTDGFVLTNNAGVLGNTFLGLLCEVLAASFTINLNSADPQTLYTVPAGYDFLLTRYMYREPSEDLSASPESVAILNKSAVTIHEQFLNEAILTVDVFDAPDKQRQIWVDAATIFNAGNSIIAQMSDVYGSAATLDIDIFGYFRPAAAVAETLTFSAGAVTFSSVDVTFTG